MDEGVVHEKTYIEGLDYSEVMTEKNEEAYCETIDLMKRGLPFIYQGCIQIERDGVVYRGRPDILEKREGASHFGKWHYKKGLPLPCAIRHKSHMAGHGPFHYM